MTSSTWSRIGSTSTSGVPGSGPSASTMIPAWSSPRPISSSARIIPRDGWPRSSRSSSGSVEDREERTRQRHRDGRARLEVPRAADDLTSIALPHVDLAHAQPIGVRVRADLEHAADEEAPEVAVDVRYADVEHALHLERRREEPSAISLAVASTRDVLAEPGQRRAHQNCPSRRGSLRQSSRRSGIPWRSTAMRSSPQPNAKPVYCSGS